MYLLISLANHPLRAGVKGGVFSLTVTQLNIMELKAEYVNDAWSLYSCAPEAF